MVTYDLQRLGGAGFQDVVSALAIKVLGAHVRPMGRGKDGGRDMIVDDGVIQWHPDEHYENQETWKGTTVFQVKHKERLENHQRDLTSLWSSIKIELEAWANPGSGRGDVPDYLVFATNIHLTPVSGTGGFDQINSKIQKYLDNLKDESAEDNLPRSAQSSAQQKRHVRRDRMRNLRKWRLWDGYQINGLLDAHEGVRRAFDGFLTAGDVLGKLSGLSTHLSSEELGPALTEHARGALLAERDVYFDEAGARDTGGVPVEHVAIDLPILVANSHTRDRVVRYVLNRGDRMLKPTLTTFDKPRHLVITGAPGNGKSTVAKFLTHAYRAAWVREDTDLGEDYQEVVAGTVHTLENMGCNVPAHRRWPINVDLARLAADLATNSEYNLLQWIAATLSRQSASKVIPHWALWSWLKSWPGFIVFDGLDEVTEPSVRQALIASLKQFVADSETHQCDLLVIVTTRPTGYHDEMPPKTFERVDLAELSAEDALRYGRLVTSVRVPHDQERREGVIALLEEAAQDENLRHLLRTPLQTLIMAIIAESSGRFSPSRFKLFWSYYQTIEQREQNKRLGYSHLLRNHSQQILDLHRRVGLRLQKQSETATGSDAVLSEQDLHDEAWQVLHDAEYEPSTSDRTLLNQMLLAATNRLVLLTPQQGGGYGFDVRSLQELMAAYALTTGSLEETLPRLTQIAASPHWRNTFLFAAGRYFDEPQPHQQKAITDLVLGLDKDASERLGAFFPVGPRLAMEIVDDGMVSEPRYLNRLVSHGLKTLNEPGGFDAVIFARMLMSAAAVSDRAREIIADDLRSALGSTSVPRSNAEDVQGVIHDFGDQLTTSAQVLALAKIKRNHSKSLPDDDRPDWLEFQETIQAFSEPDTEVVLHSVGQALEAVTTHQIRSGHKDQILSCLVDSDLSLFVEDALRHVMPASRSLGVFLRQEVLPAVWRRPVDFELINY